MTVPWGRVTDCRGAWSGWAAGADPGALLPCRCHARGNCYPPVDGHRDSTAASAPHQPEPWITNPVPPEPRKPSNDSAPQFWKRSRLAGLPAVPARKAPWDACVVTRLPPPGRGLGRVNRWSRGGTLERVLPLWETPRESCHTSTWSCSKL